MNTILLVEDNADNRKLVTWALEDAGYECVAVDSRREGGIALGEKQLTWC